jgi:hypothetical protein
MGAVRGVVTEVRRLLDDSGLSGSELIAASTAKLEQNHWSGAAAATAQAASLNGLPFLPGRDGEWVGHVRDGLQEIDASALELEARGMRGRQRRAPHVPPPSGWFALGRTARTRASCSSTRSARRVIGGRADGI